MMFFVFIILNLFSDSIVTYDSLINASKKHLELKNYDEAVTMANKARILKQSSYEVYNVLGLVYYSKGDYKQSIDNFKKSNSIKKSAVNYYNIGLAYSNLKRYQKAIANYEKCLEIEPEYEHANSAIAGLYLKLKNPTKAIDVYKKILEADPNSIDALTNIGCLYAYNTVDIEELNTASSYLTKAKEKDPTNSRITSCLELVEKNILSRRK